jgi:hypothetical protein
MIYVIKSGHDQYVDYYEAIDAVLEGPAGLCMTELYRDEYAPSRPVKRRQKDGKLYKDGRKDWSEGFHKWLVRVKGFKSLEFQSVTDGENDDD